MTAGPITLIVLGVLGVLVVLLGAALWSLTHIRPGEWSSMLPEGTGSERHREMTAGLCLAQCSEGNAVTLLQNGREFWPALRDAMKGAQQSIHFETYLWESGELSASLLEVLCEKAQQGIEVRMTIDANGGGEMKEAERKKLRDAGAKLAFFRPPTWKHVGTYNGRDHRKLAVIDSRVAFVGGHCVTDNWLGDADRLDRYRDLSVQVRGPLVAQVQTAFAENWTEVTGHLLASDRYFPTLPAVGPCHGYLAFINFERRVSAVKTLYMLAITSAQRTLHIQNPYFLPDPAAQQALKRAVKRGVKVQVMTPRFEATDSELVLHAMRHNLKHLLEAGVEVYGYTRTLLHQKVITVDGVWSIIGSTNFDFRSFEINEEASLSLFDRELANEMLAVFNRDLADCTPYTVAELESRNPWQRVRDLGAWLIREQL